jgi:molybdopterin converting factor small subunit
MTLLYFAQARRVTGIPSETLDAAALRLVIRLARNGEFAPLDARFHPDDEIALIPPVSGG